MKKILSVTMILVLMMTLATGTAFAGNGKTAQENEVPVYLTAPAIGDGAGGIDFTITDRIDMKATAGSTVLDIDKLVIVNNAATGQLRLESIQAVAENGWTIKKDDASYFANLKADTEEFSLVTDGNDFSVNATKTYGEPKLIAPDKVPVEISFTGHIGTFLNPIPDTQVAKIIATVSPY